MKGSRKGRRAPLRLRNIQMHMRLRLLLANLWRSSLPLRGVNVLVGRSKRVEGGGEISLSLADASVLLGEGASYASDVEFRKLLLLWSA